jgi:hypothetical protein
VHVASLLDIAGIEAAVVQQRAQPRDYLDIDALIRHGIDLPQVLAAGTTVYGGSFNPLITLRRSVISTTRQHPRSRYGNG